MIEGRGEGGEREGRGRGEGGEREGRGRGEGGEREGRGRGGRGGRGEGRRDTGNVSNRKYRPSQSVTSIFVHASGSFTVDLNIYVLGRDERKREKEKWDGDKARSRVGEGGKGKIKER